jgi:hypothetical protein
VRSANAQCPAFGADTTCGVVVTVTNKGATVSSTGQGPYDGIDDTLIGIVNNSSVPVKSLVLTSTLDIFGFDGDGIDTYGAPGNNLDRTGYGGPNAYYTNINAGLTSGTVNFITPVAPNGGTTHFSLENALGSATACTDFINNALMHQASGKNICATFTPKQNYTLNQAAQVCGFANFDWLQQITTMFDPSPFYARNLSGGFDPTVSGQVRLTSKRVPWSDPPQGGGYMYEKNQDFSYPFYYDRYTELPGKENGTVPAACTLPASAGNTLTFHDAPADPCFPGGSLNGSALCTDSILTPGATSTPRGSFVGFYTHLAGVNFDGTATDLGIGFTWTSTNNGTTGGVMSTKTNLPADGNGTGGVTITSVNEISTYQGVTVIGVNGGGMQTAGVLSSGTTCDGLYTGTFKGDIYVSAKQSCTFINGYITGSVRSTQGGNLDLSGVLVGGDVQIAESGTYSIGPSTTIDGNLNIMYTQPGMAQNQVCGSIVSGDLLFQNNQASVQIGSGSETTCIGNQIGHSLFAFNTGPTHIFGNTVNGPLECYFNTHIDGGMNNARPKSGQCAGF